MNVPETKNKTNIYKLIFFHKYKKQHPHIDRLHTGEGWGRHMLLKCSPLSFLLSAGNTTLHG